jgi:lipoprotein signal peptidase
LQLSARQEVAMQSHVQYWFAAKRYGWGWGFPVTWQGWLALVAYVGLVVAGVFIFPPRHSLVAFIAYVVVLGLLFTGLCWWKGEPPKWRWGGE